MKKKGMIPMKKMKRISAFVLALMLAISGLILPGMAEEANGVAISTAEELAAIETSGNYYLTKDILISGAWQSPENFAGVLDGNGHTIVLSGAEVTGGLFGKLSSATVKNLNITDGQKKNTFTCVNNCFGVIAPLASGTLENLVVNVNVDFSAAGDTVNGAGLVGAVSGGDLTLTDCVNGGNVTAYNSAAGMVAGSSGATNATLRFERCINYGDILSKKNSGGMLACSTACGSLVVRECVNRGHIAHTTRDNTGSMVGYYKPAASGVGTIDLLDNVNYGSVTIATGKGSVGGIIAGLNVNSLPKESIVIKGNISYSKVAVLFPDALKNNDLAEIDGNYIADEYGKLPEEAGTVLDSSVYVVENRVAVLTWMEDKAIGDRFPSVSHEITEKPDGEQTESEAIVSAEEFSTKLNGTNGNYYLANDITIAGTWTSPTGFSGTLDGRGHSVILNGATVTGGIFNSLQGATVKNLTIKEGSDANTLAMLSDKFGFLSDVAWGKLENITVNGTVSFTGNTNAYVGGLIGEQAGAGALEIVGCVNNAAVTSGRLAGGIIASISTARIAYCINNGAVFSESNCAAGIVALSSGALGLTVESCINNGTVTMSATQNVGGIAGYIKPAAFPAYIKFLNNVNHGNITNKTAGGATSGIVGFLNAGSTIADLRGNVNNGAVTGGANCAPIMGRVSNNDLAGLLYNFDSASVEALGEGDKNYVALSAEALSLLNAVYPGVYTPLVGGKTTLLWSVVRTLDSASIRMAEPTGLRFMTEFDKSWLDSLVAEYGRENLVIGTLITPVGYVKEAGEFTAEALDKLTGHEVKYLNVIAGEAYETKGDTYHYAGSVADLYEENYTRDYAAIGYITVNGETYYSPTYTVRNAAWVAEAALADVSDSQNEEYCNAVTVNGVVVYSPYTQDQREVLAKFSVS